MLLHLDQTQRSQQESMQFYAADWGGSMWFELGQYGYWYGFVIPGTYLALFVCLFVCFQSHEQFFSYLATVTIAGDRAANLDLCLALTAFSSEGSFTCHTYCDTKSPFLRSYPKDPWFSLLNVVLVAMEQSLPILNALGLTWQTRAGQR
jgi:hypothetical protein